MAEARRLDAELVVRGLARSRARAHELVDAGSVFIDGRPALKASTPVPRQARLEIASSPASEWLRAPEPPGGWVGRGAGKLLAALRTWPDVADAIPGARALDVGASTGGFTQVLLAAGACSVLALDVGRGQLAPELARDPRVVERSGTSIRDVRPGDLGGPFDVVVADLSFISLTLVIGSLAAQLADRGNIIVLVKPQFEVGQQRIGRRGVVRQPELRRAALSQVVTSAEAVGLHPHGVGVSPITGGAGNVEYLLWLRADPSATMTGEIPETMGGIPEMAGEMLAGTAGEDAP